MSRASGFAKFVNAPWTRIKPNLCPFCEHYRFNSHWYGECAAKRTILSNPHTDAGRCKDYQQSTPKQPPEWIASVATEGKYHKAGKR